MKVLHHFVGNFILEGRVGKIYVTKQFETFFFALFFSPPLMTFIASIPQLDYGFIEKKNYFSRCDLIGHSCYRKWHGPSLSNSLAKQTFKQVPNGY